MLSLLLTDLTEVEYPQATFILEESSETILLFVDSGGSEVGHVPLDVRNRRLSLGMGSRFSEAVTRKPRSSVLRKIKMNEIWTNMNE